MKGYQQQQDANNTNKFKMTYVAMNPNNDKYSLENEEEKNHKEQL